MHRDSSGESFESDCRVPVRRRSGKKPIPPSLTSEFDLNLFLVLRARLLREAARFGHGDWRIADDAVDLALDRVANVLLGPSSRHPSAWLPYAVRVYQNLVRSGSSSVALRRIKTVSLTAEHELIAAPEPDERQASPRAKLGEFLLESFTASEAAAVSAYWITGGIRAAAAALGWSPRDVRKRVQRAGLKLQREFRGDPSPPPSLNGAEQHRSAFQPS